MSLDTTPTQLLLSHLHNLAERMLAFGWRRFTGPEPHPEHNPKYRRLTPEEKEALELEWAARERGRFAEKEANLLVDFTASCKALGCADPAGYLTGRAPEDFGAESEAVKGEVVELFRLAAAGLVPALAAKVLKLSEPVLAGVRLASRFLSAEAERRGRSPHPDGPDGGRWLWCGGKRYDIPSGNVYRLIEFMWARGSADYDDLWTNDVLTDPLEPQSMRSLVAKANATLKKPKNPSVPWRLSANSNSRHITKKASP
jgi:hypothetical protein